MKATGIIRKIDDMGRIVLPREILKSMELALKDPIEFYVDDFDNIILKKVESGCVFCNSRNNTVEYMGKTICRECLLQL